MRRTRHLLALSLVVVLLIATACSDDSGDDSDSTGDDTTQDRSGPSNAEVPFEDTNWVLTDASDLGVRLGDVVVTARFVGERVTGSGGCNTYDASAFRDGSKLEIGDDILSTTMGCPAPQSTVEGRYLAALPEVRTFAIDGTQLTLRTMNGAALLVYRATGVDDLLGDWVVTSLYTGNAIQSVVGGVELTATFTKDAVSGNGGCNRYNGMAVITATTIALGPLASTLVGCEEPVASQEQQYLAALELARTYEVSGDRLTLFRDGGTIAVTFDRA